jgi:hypothetical protein
MKLPGRCLGRASPLFFAVEYPAASGCFAVAGLESISKPRIITQAFAPYVFNFAPLRERQFTLEALRKETRRR